MNSHCNPFGVLVGVLVSGLALAQAVGDTQDQFYRYAENKNKSFEPHLPGETVDHFTGNLHIIQEDLSLPGHAGLDLHILRSYSSKIWGRADLLSSEPLLADKDPSAAGFGWTMHMGRVRNPNATAFPTACGGGDYPVYEAPDGSARTFYPLVASNTNFISRDSWKFSKNCTLTGGGTGVCITTTTGQRLEFAQSAQYFIGTGTTLVFPLTAIVDVFGNTIKVTYTAGLVNVITDTLNRTVTFNYTPCGIRSCLNSIHAAGSGGGSRDVTYSYTTFTGTGSAGHFPLPSPGRAFLTGVQPAAGPGYAYEYGTTNTVAQNQYALSKITYPWGGSTTYAYDTSSFFTGRESVPMAVVASRTTSGRAVPTATWTYSYSAPAMGDFQTTTVTRPDLLNDVYQFYGFGYPSSKSPAIGNVWIVGLQRSVSRANAAEVVTQTWDKGQLITTANYSAPVYDGSSACPNWTWDITVQAPVMTNRVLSRGLSRYEMDFAGHNGFGEPATVTERGEAQTSTPAVRVSTFTYSPDVTTYQMVHRIKTEHVCQGAGPSDCYDNSRTFLGANATMDTETIKGVKSTFGYTPPEGNLHTVTNALGATVTLTGYAAGFGLPTLIDFNGAYSLTRSAFWDGNLKSETNGHGDVTSYTYDAAGRLQTVTPPGTNDATTYTYAAAGDSYSDTKGTGAGLYTSSTALDGLGRVTQTSNSLGEKQTYEYDKMTRPSFKSYPFKTGSPEVGDKLEYDGLDRPTVTSRRFVATSHLPLAGACADPASCKLTVSYPAGHCRASAVDRALGDAANTTECFDSFGDVAEERLVSVTDANGKPWSYAYDVVGGLKTFKAALQAGDRSFTYASATFFPKTETSGPRGTFTNLTHNLLGQALTQRDSRPVDTTLTYADPLSRTTLTKYGTGSPADVTRTYDKDTLKTMSSINGGAYTYTYDELNRVRSVSWVYGGHTYLTSYVYDRTGCLTDLTYPTGTIGTTLTMTCDARGRTASVKIGTQIIASNVAYQPGGRPTSITYGNGKTVTAVIENGRVKSIATPGVLGLTYVYDGANNVKSITDAVVPTSTVSSITYDKLDRLLTATSPQGIASFLYDDLGNRKSKTLAGGPTTTYAYDPTTNLLKSSNGPGAPGPMMFTWNPAGRLESSSDGATYKYNGNGLRVAKQSTVGSVDVVYHYDVSGHLLAETLPDGTKIREFYYVADQLVAVDGCVSGFSTACSERQWYHTDVLGNVVARTDSTGAIVDRFAYHPWGEPQTTVSGTRLFNGRTFDSGTGFYDFGARYYSPELGRFLSCDAAWTQVGNPQGSNLYGYALNNPYKYSDPSGRIPFLLITAGIGAVIGAGVAAYVTYDSKTGVNWTAVGAGAVGGGLIGLGVGYVASTVVAGSGTASTGAVLKGALAWGAGLLGFGGKAIEYGEKEFSSEPGAGAIASNVIQTGTRMVFQNFTIGTTGGNNVSKNGAQLYSAAKMILDFARINGAKTLTFEGTFQNQELAKRYGMELGEEFSFTVDATLKAMLAAGNTGGQ